MVFDLAPSRRPKHIRKMRTISVTGRLATTALHSLTKSQSRYIDIRFWSNYKLQQTFLAISHIHCIVVHGGFTLGRSSLAKRRSAAADRKRIRCHIRATIGRNTLHTCKCIFTHLRYNANTRRDIQISSKSTLLKIA